MISFGLTLNRLLVAISKSWEQEHFRVTLILAMFVLMSGTSFYVVIEDWSFVDALYFSAVTAATVGYGDLAPVTNAGKMFSVAYMFVSIGVFVALFGQIARTLIVDLEQHGKRSPRSGANDSE